MIKERPFADAYLKQFPVIEELDGADACSTETEPPGYDDPNNGTVPYSIPATARYDYDCHLDGLAYHSDGRLFVDRPVGSNQDTVYTCDFSANGNGCTLQTEVASLSRFTSNGDPPGVSVFVYVRDERHNNTWFPFWFNTTSDYEAILPTNNATLLLNNFNITSLVAENCTDLTPPPLLDPIPPGLGCHQLTETLVFMQLNNLTIMKVGNVSLWDDVSLDNIVDPGELTDTHCTINQIPTFSCVAGPMFYGSEQLYVSTGPNTFAPPTVTCNVSNSAQVPLEVACRYETLYYAPNMLGLVPLTNQYGNLSVPCHFDTPAKLECSVNATGPALAAFNETEPQLPLVYYSNDTGPHLTVPCLQNPNDSPPLCEQVNITYSSGTVLRVRIEGSDIRFYADDVREPLKCAIYNTAGATIESTDTDPRPAPLSADSTVLEQVDAYFGGAYAPPATPVRAVYNFTAMVERTVRRVRAEQAMATPRMASAKRAFMESSSFRKKSLLCCLAATLRAAGQTLTAFAFELVLTIQSLLSLPASIPSFTFTVPTFRVALTNFRLAVCELACTVMSLLSDFYSCASISGTITCSSGSSCGQGLLCHAADVPLLILEIGVEILTTVKAIVDNDANPESAMLGSSCNADNGM